MGLFGSFKKKKKSSELASAPNIADLPPIPEPDSGLDLPPSDDLSNMDLPEIPTDDSILDLPASNLSLNDSPNKDSLKADLSEISPDHPLPNLSPKDLDPALLDDLSSSPVEDDSLNSQKPEISENKIEEVPQAQEEPVVLKSESEPSLPVFEEVTASNQIDMDSLAISELFIKQEHYGQVLEMLHNTKKELDALVKKSVVAKPNEKIRMLLKKATAKHTDLNKGLMFVEEHLIE